MRDEGVRFLRCRLVSVTCSLLSMDVDLAIISLH